METSILVKQAIEGDRDSLEWVVGHLTPLVEHQVRYRLGSLARNAADVEDISGEVWAVVLRKLPELKPREGRYAPVLAKYLGTTARFLCNNFLKRAVRRRVSSLEDQEAGADSLSGLGPDVLHETRTIVTRISQSETSALIRAALERLDEDKRQVLIFRLLEHKSNSEIAELLNLRPNTVAVRYRRALAELREELPAQLFSDLWDLHGMPTSDA